MNSNVAMKEKRMARITGLALVLMVITAGYGFGYAFNRIFITGDQLSTYNNLIASTGLLRAIILSFSIILLLDVIVAWSFYYLFKNINGPLATLSSWLRLLYAAILAIAIACLIFVSQIPVNNQQYVDLIFWLFNCFLQVWSFGLIIFGFHLLLLFVLLLQSAIVPKPIALLTLFAAVCYIITNSLQVFLPAYQTYKETVDLFLAIPMAMGELVLAIWLLVTKTLNK